MFRRTLAMIISGIIIFTTYGIQATQAQTASQSRQAEKARAKVQQIGVGPEARVEVKLKDSTKFKGYVSAATADSFTITDSRTGATQTVGFAEVAQVKKPGSGLSTRTLFILGGAAVAAIIVGVTVVRPVVCDGGAGC